MNNLAFRKKVLTQGKIHHFIRILRSILLPFEYVIRAMNEFRLFRRKRQEDLISTTLQWRNDLRANDYQKK
jgi:hypothetical protein